MVYMYTFIVTNMDSSPEYLVKFYCKRGLMENFIKESKSGFDFSAVSSHNRIVNANRVQVYALAYNIFNWFRRLVLSAKMWRQCIDTVRLKLLKIATKVVHSARYITFKLCSSCQRTLTAWYFRVFKTFRLYLNRIFCIWLLLRWLHTILQRRCLHIQDWYLPGRICPDLLNRLTTLPGIRYFYQCILCRACSICCKNTDF